MIPVIISSDKTQLTLFRNKAAYPVYITIGNLPKAVRSRPSQGGQILLGYLPTSKLEHITNKSKRRRVQANLFHQCMRKILEPLVDAGLDGINMTSGDGATRRCHPIYAAYVADYPEQVLVTCVKSGDCIVCIRRRHELGTPTLNTPKEPPAHSGDIPRFETATRDLSSILDVLATADDVSATDYTRACHNVGIRPVYQPFWEHLPYADIYASITPDILHQLLQGVVKHLFAWVKSAYSEDEINARCRRLPPNHNVRLFFNGVTKLSRLTGREHADICRILLGIIIDMPLSTGDSPVRIIRSVRAILDFVYLAQYPLHSTQSLQAMEDALQRFHDNKKVFVDLGIRQDFNFPKLHFTEHYRHLIETFGTTDNFNTEYTERLHIDLAKEAYRATNHKEEYVQMTLWLERKEKVLQHDRYVKWCQAGRPSWHVINSLHVNHSSHIQMTREPSVKAVPFYSLVDDYGAQDFAIRLAEYIVGFNDSSGILSRAQIRRLAENVRLPFNKVPVYHKAKFWEADFPRYRHASDEFDVVHSTPARQDKRGNVVPGRFDTALLNDGSGGAVGVQGMLNFSS